MDVLGRLQLHDVQDVVHRNDPDEPPGVVHYREHRQVVVGNDASHDLLVGVRRDRHHIRVHDVPDQDGGGRDDQLPEGEYAQEAAGLVHHVQVVDRLGVGTRLPQVFEDSSHRHGGFDGDIGGRHQPAGLLLLVARELLDDRSRLWLQQRTDRGRLVRCCCVQVLEHVGEVVRVQLLEGDPGVTGWHRGEELRELLRRQVRDQFRRALRG